MQAAHLLAIERSIALHREVAERIRRNPELIEQARRRVKSWLSDNSVSRPYAEAWAAILQRPLDGIADAIIERSERAHDLRQVSPFAGVVDPRTRWRILRETKTRIAS